MISLRSTLPKCLYPLHHVSSWTIQSEFLGHQPNVFWVEYSPMVWETLGSVSGRIIPKTLKIVLDTALLNTQQYKVHIKGKVEKSRVWNEIKIIAKKGHGRIISLKETVNMLVTVTC